jgi:fermentation-respiration switch protein FrsA (DUF1100 family)
MTEVRTRRRPVRGAIAVLVLAAATSAFTAPVLTAAAAPAKDGATAVHDVATYAVGKAETTFVDTSRATAPNNSYPGDDTRTLLTTIYYPAKGTPAATAVDIRPTVDAPPLTASGPYPLIVFSHGALARGVVYERQAAAWASAGYVVVAPDFPLSNTNAPGGASLTGAVGDVENQPADDSFVIDQVLALNRDGSQGSPLHQLVDPKRIGAAGHSNGAITTYGLVYTECCTDPRVKAAIAESGVAGIVDDAPYFQGKNTPLFILHGDDDPLVPYSAGQAAYDRAKAPKFFLTFLGADHINPFVGAAGLQGTAMLDATTDFWDRYLKGDRSALARMRKAATVPNETTFEEDTGASARSG